MFPGHEPIFSELIDRWLYFGHEVSLIKNKYTQQWNENISKIPAGIAINSKEKPDVIFCSAHSKTVLYALFYKFRRLWSNVPIVVSHFWFPDRRILPLYYMVHHISVCKYGADYLKKISGVNSELIYLPVDTKIFKPKKTPNEKVATIIGNNFKVRSGSGKSRNIMGTEYLFQIFNLVHQMDSEIKLVLNGYNPDLELPPFVKKTFFPKDYKTGLYNVISNSSCVFFTTTRNLIMHSMENAMSAGKIPICWDLLSFHEVIENGKSGFLIEKFDVKAFAEKIVEVCNKPSDKMGKKSRESVVEKCERDMVAQKHIEFFEEILSK